MLQNLNHPSKYIFLLNGRYRVIKTTNKKRVDYGGYNSLEKTLHYVDFLKRSKWKVTPLKLQKYYSSYIFIRPSGKYAISKWKNNKKVCYGSFKHEKQAKYYVYMLIRTNWRATPLRAPRGLFPKIKKNNNKSGITYTLRYKDYRNTFTKLEYAQEEAKLLKFFNYDSIDSFCDNT